MTLLLDTTFCIDVLRERNGRRELLDELASAGHILGTSVINIAELYAGARQGEEQTIAEFLSVLQFYPTTAAIGQLAGELKRAAARKGRTVGLADALIAATAVHHRFVLVTDNRKDFDLPGLELFPLP